ncbi:HAD ATPase, P-type, IC family protein [Candidatus Phytoplasma oryzae]|uniref:HAD ATPase, P-type, IC family protein n=1 Tax=Candidatus Phytoplasma oryzae TaxID=203274 RepID=A0A139JQA1_9MOLU|nr:cation-transporting P-type ATPase [Candidatus Phytoplasma oryzae]KXT29142.1 HAD ATPase, P-type, IC family protein [Candidatus Phytoplasma oryzae]RAM57752.1 hypothetical protein DH96_01470 [Candidatus Phytoplasma oryzae]
MNISLYQLEIDVLEKKIKTNLKTGLTEKKVKKKLSKYGLNKIIKNNKISSLKIFLKQFNSFFVYILLIASFSTLFIGLLNNKKEEIIESILILIIIFSNAFLGFFYEKKKEKSLKIIKKKTQSYTKVLRNNELKLILREKLVPGDIVIVEQGDIVPADLRIINSNNLKINESILTGENLIVEKNNNINIKNIKLKPYLFDINNALFMNTNIIHGYAKTVVIQTGLNTQIGQITKLVSKTKKIKTPLEKNINDLTKILSFIILILISINFILNILKYKFFYHQKINFFIIKKFLLSSIILAVAVIPEGLPAIVTIILTLGIRRIAKKKTIIKNLKSLETLGAINVICTDKTGTLTKNQMKIKKLYLYNKNIELSEYQTFNKTKNEDIIKLINYGILCNNDFNIGNQNKNILSDPVDQSFLNLANDYNFDINMIKKNNIKIKEFPFDNQNKLMMAIYQKNNNFFIIIKGACEILLKLSNYIESKNNIFEKNNFYQNIIDNKLSLLSEEGYKVLTISYAPLKKTDFLKNFLKNNISINEILSFLKKKIIFLGAVAIEDPIREKIQITIQDCKKAFIKPVMITGDHLNTAKNIASKTGIIQNKNDLAITGEILENLSTEEFIKKLPNIKVFARVSPEHKFKIIQTYQKIGCTVAMIGDGINDAPSIKIANVGIAMGITGTEITKQAADIILTDDNFETLKKAILEGRNIFNNIKKSILFLLSCNIGEIFVILFNTCVGHLIFLSNFDILNSLQILWINLITDSLVAIALGLEPKDYNLIKEKPRKIKNSLLNKKLVLKILLEGILIGFITFVSAFIGYKNHNNSHQYGQTFAFMVLSLSQLIHSFNLRNLNKSIFILKPNLYLRLFFGISISLQILICFIPIFQKYFQLSNLSRIDIIIIFLLSILPLIIVEIVKFLLNKIKKN